MYKSFLIIMLLVLCSFSNPNDTDKLVVGAAQKDLAYFLGKIPQGQETNYGFTSQDTMQQCTLGRPVRMVTFKDEFYGEPPARDKEYILVRNEWRVPVILNGSNRALITVNEDQGNYSVSGIGAAVLARELEQMIVGASADEDIYILRVYSLRADFFVKATGNALANAQYIPMTSVKMALPSSNKTSYTLSEVQNMVYQDYINHPEKN